MAKSNWYSYLWKDLFRKVLAKEECRLEFLKSTAFFSGFSDKQIELTAEFLHERRFAKQEIIFEIGHPGAALYFIETGEVAIEVPQDGDRGSIRLATLGPGAFFGELALLDDTPRSATARATADTVVLALPRSELSRLSEQSPILGGQVYRALAQITSSRLKATIERMQSEDGRIKMVVNG